MGARSRREALIGAPTLHPLVVVTLMLFHAVAKTICLMPGKRAADVAKTASCRAGGWQASDIGMRLL